jgi:hypothetical protein
MVFAGIGVVNKSDLLLVDESIDADQYVQNVDRLGFTVVLDRRHRLFGWIFQQDGAPGHTSRVALEWLEESVDRIVEAVVKSKSALVVPWAMIPQTRPTGYVEVSGPDSTWVSPVTANQSPISHGK